MMRITRHIAATPMPITISETDRRNFILLTVVGAAVEGLSRMVDCAAVEGLSRMVDCAAVEGLSRMVDCAAVVVAGFILHCSLKFAL